MSESILVSSTPLILDLDQHLHREALLEAIRSLQILSGYLTLGSDPHYLTQKALVRLTYLALHCQMSSEIHSEIRLLHRESQRLLAQTLQSQTISGPLTLAQLQR